MAQRRIRTFVVGWRLPVIAVVAVLAVLGSAAPASAHNELRASTPQDGQTLPTAPTAIVLTFNEPAVAMGTQIAVSGPSGVVSVGEPQLTDNTVTQPLQPGAPAGAYTVTWRVTSADGHPVTGTLSFTSSAAAPGSPGPPGTSVSPTPGPPQPTRIPGSLKLLIGAVAIIFGVTVARRARRDNANRP